MIVSEDDIRTIVRCIQQRYGGRLSASKVTMSTYGWSHPVLNLIDCVLSLNRKYYQFAKPRVEKFKREHREIITLAQLQVLISQCGGPAAFFKKELNCNYASRARMFNQVLNQLIEIVGQFPGSNELQRIGNWAHSVSPENYKDFDISGFGLAGFQYLRMLFGVDTVKPDRYIKEFVKECLGKGVSDMRALFIIETAAKKMGYSPRQVDSMIWADYATKKCKTRC